MENRLTLIEEQVKRQGKNWLHKFQCTCGNTTLATKGNVQRNGIRSCGCIKKEMLVKKNTTHGLRYRDVNMYNAWKQMKQRCTNSNCFGYEYYGGRGISIYKDWSKYENFYNWSINNGYEEGLSLDRINPDGNYEPNNCRWATRAVQAKNKRYDRGKTICSFIEKGNPTIKDLISIKELCTRMLNEIEFSEKDLALLYEDAKRK